MFSSLIIALLVLSPPHEAETTAESEVQEPALIETSLAPKRVEAQTVSSENDSSPQNLGADSVVPTETPAHESEGPSPLLEALTSTDFFAEEKRYRGDLPGADRQSGIQFQSTLKYAWTLPGEKLLLFRADAHIDLSQPYWLVYESSPVWEHGRDYPDFLLRQSEQITPETGRFATGHGHLDDTTVDVSYGGESDDGFLYFVGVNVVFPTNDDTSNGRDQTLLGPDVTLGWTRSWGYAAARATHVIDVRGDDSFQTRETNIQGKLSWNLTDALRFVSNPTVTYDWEGSSKNKLLLPVGGGLSTTISVGRLALTVNVEAYEYVITAERYGVSRVYRFALTPTWLSR